jgi:Glycosyl hydrolases family 43
MLEPERRLEATPRASVVVRMVCAAAVALLLCGVGLVASGSRRPTGTHLRAGQLHIDPPEMADPTGLVVDDTAYVFGTNRGGENVPILTSTDMYTWYYGGDAVPAETYPAWAEIRDRTWAPSVMKLSDNSFVLYVSLPTKADGGQCVAVLMATSVTGPYSDPIGRPLFCGWRGSRGAIDPSVMRLSDGRVFLYTKVIAFDRQLWVHELAPDGLSIIENRSWPVLTATQKWEQGGIENPVMVPDVSGWWLMYSGSWWTDGRYGTGVARCSGPAGPCRKQSRQGPWLGTAPGRVGPGGADFITLRGQRYIVHQVWSGGARRLAVQPVTFGDNGPQLG